MVCRGSTSLEHCAVFLREERLYCQLDVLFDFPPFDEFRTSCCFLKGGKSSIRIVRYCLISLECRAVFLREESLLFELFVAA